jgi:hypothetical protein
MLPRSKSPGRFGSHGNGSMDSRKVVLVVMLVIFGAYFAFVNTYFSFSPTADKVEPLKLDPYAAAARRSQETEGTPAPKWVRNPNRKYVWLDIAIDDVPVGRVTAEVRLPTHLIVPLLPRWY